MMRREFFQITGTSGTDVGTEGVTSIVPPDVPGLYRPQSLQVADRKFGTEQTRHPVPCHSGAENTQTGRFGFWATSFLNSPFGFNFFRMFKASINCVLGN